MGEGENSVLLPHYVLHILEMASPTVLLLCGSFNPVTMAHIRLAERVAGYLQGARGSLPDRIVFSPTHERYPFKHLELSVHRIAMLRIAIRSSVYAARMEVNSLEADYEGGFQRTYIVVQKLRDYYLRILGGAEPSPGAKAPGLAQQASGSGEPAGLSMYLAAGTDLLGAMLNTSVWPEDSVRSLFQACTVVAVARDFGIGAATVPEIRNRLYAVPYLREACERGQIVFLNTPVSSASSTVVRAAFGEKGYQAYLRAFTEGSPSPRSPTGRRGEATESASGSERSERSERSEQAGSLSGGTSGASGPSSPQSIREEAEAFLPAGVEDYIIEHGLYHD